MDDTDFRKFNEYLPYYGPEWDALKNDNGLYSRPGLLCFPASTGSDKSAHPPTSLSNSAVFSENEDNPELGKFMDESDEDYQYRKDICESFQKDRRLR